VERHKIPRGGGYWKSYDFRNNTDRQNIFRYPLGPDGVKDAMGNDFFDPNRVFKHAGGEMIFSLSNGLQGYFLADSEGNRIDKAPLEIVQNLAGGPGNDPVISNGISCITCHTSGMQAFDWKAEHLRQTINWADPAKVAENYDKQAALKLLSTAEEINAMVKKDTDRFLDAMEKTADYENSYFSVRGGVVGSEEPISLLTAHYEGGLDLTSAAGELGVREDELKKKIKLVDELQKLGLQALLVKADPGVARESWEKNYTKIYRYVTEPYEEFALEFPLELKTFVGANPPIGRGVLAWSHDQNSSFLFSSGRIDKAGLLLRWDAHNWLPKPGDPPIPFNRQERVGILQMAFSPTDPTRLALVNTLVKNEGVLGAQSLEILDISKPDKVIKRFQVENLDRFNGFAWSPNGKEIAATYSRRQRIGNRGITRVKIFDATTYKLLREKQIVGAVSLGWSPDGKHLAITTHNRANFDRITASVEIWDGELKKRHKVFGGSFLDWSSERKNKRPEDPFSSRIAILNRPDIVTVVEVGVKRGDENKTGDLQELKFGKEKFANAEHKFGIERPQAAGRGRAAVGSVAWSADGRMLAGSSQKGIIIWNSDTLNVIKEIPIDAARFGTHQLAWRSDGRMIAARFGDGIIRVFRDIK